MRSYRQYCAAAKALDVVGDRWNLLIVRELLLTGSCRYSDLLAGLPGIATNLLADRLRDLERDGVLERDAGEPAGGDRPLHADRAGPRAAARARSADAVGRSADGVDGA